MSNTDFQAHLRRQLGFLKSSAASFDSGFNDEAIRIATVIRVLVHQTKSSTSLLKHLNSTTINLLSTTEGATERTLMYMGMGRMRIFSDGSHSYFPSLSDSPHAFFIPVSEWWDQVVFVGGGQRLSRRKIVLSAANKDGGAHVDKALDPEYEALTSGFAGFVGIHIAGQEKVESPLNGAHYVALRQMAHEILNSPELLAIAG